jgi:hypothetical protein
VILQIVFAALMLQHWVMVTDIHLNPFAETARPRGQDTSRELWSETLREMHAVDGDAPVVVVGGDFLAHQFASLARVAGQNPQQAGIATMRGIATDLRRAFPHAQFLITLGNNDDPCGDYVSDVGGPYLAALARIFAPLVNAHGAAPQFASSFVRGGYYTVRLPIRGERGIVLNSIFWSVAYHGSCYGGSRNPGGDEMNWLRPLLSSGKSIVLMHIPPGYDPSSTALVHRVVAIPFLGTGFDAELVSLFARDRSHVAFALAGHTHRYDFRIPGGVPMLIASAVSPVYRNNPAFYELEVGTDGNLHDVVPFVYDPFSEVWQREASFDAMYGINGFTTANLRKVSDAIQRSPTVRSTWSEAYSVWSWRVDDVGQHYWPVYWCAQIEFGFGYARCAQTQKRTALLLGFGAIVVAGVIVWLTLTVIRLRRAQRAVRDR